MKRIVYIATMVALLASSCQKTDVLNVVEDAIDFSTQVGKLTKADYTADKFSTLKSQGFRVWAVSDFSLGIDTDGQIYRGLANLPVELTDTTCDFDPNEVTKKYFWPAAEKYLYFYVLSADDVSWLKSIDYDTNFLPESTDDAGKKVKSTEVTGLSLPEFEVKQTAHDDIMVADSIRQHKKGPNGKVVKPTFRHTMTKIEFNFKKGTVGTTNTSATEASNVILKGIEIGGYEKGGATVEGLINKGKLVITYDFAIGDSSSDDDKFPFKWDPTENALATFKAIPSTDVTIKKIGGEIISTEEPAQPAVGNVYVKYTEGTEAEDNTHATAAKREIMQYNGTAWVAIETHTYSNNTWTTEATEPQYETFAGEVLATGNDYTNFVPWYMIPQPIVRKNVRINYVADGKPLSQEFALSGTTTTGITWVEENCVKYNVTIAPHKIEFSPSVGEWDPQTNVDMNN